MLMTINPVLLFHPLMHPDLGKLLQGLPTATIMEETNNTQLKLYDGSVNQSQVKYRIKIVQI